MAGALDAAQIQLRQRIAERAQALAAVAQAQLALDTLLPESRWAAPPDLLPEWNPESPYVWVQKDLVSRLSVPVFDNDGSLRAEAALVFSTDEPAMKRLNERLSTLLHDYRQLELAGVERLEEPLPGIDRSRPSLTVRVQPAPEEGARLKQAFEAELRRHLGDQRAELLLQTGARWLKSQFGGLAEDGKTISIVQHADGTQNISIRSGGTWMSVGGVPNLGEYIPPHLLPLFNSLTDPPIPAPPIGSTPHNLD